jgi:hypothetical protein
MNRRRSSRIRPPLDSINLAWLGYDDVPRRITLREVWQSAAAKLGSSSLLWLGHAIARWFFT